MGQKNKKNILSYIQNGWEQPIWTSHEKTFTIMGVLKEKKNKPPALMEFNQIFDRISHKDKIGHLFIVDMKFHNKNSKTLLFHEIYPPIFEKNKKMNPYKRFCLQLLSVIIRNEEKDTANSFSYSSKTCSTLEEKKFIPLYGEHLHFLIKQADWLVTKIYKYYTFEQAKFKKKFVITNQKSRQKASTSIERDFFKLLNNSNLGIDCRNNIDNCILELLNDDINEISYIKKFTSIFNDDTFRNSFSPQHLNTKISFKDKIF